jgi:hypothetical protein
MAAKSKGKLILYIADLRFEVLDERVKVKGLN